MTQTTDAAPAAPRTFAAEALDTFRTVIGALLIAFVLRVIVFQPYTIPSSSMEPGLRTGDYVIASKWSYGWSRASIPFDPPLPGGRLFFRSPHRGDVVMFRLPRDPKEVYVKRLIGLPGDRVQVKAGQVFVNGQPIAQTPLGFTEDPEWAGRRVLQLQEHRPDGRAYVTYDSGQDDPGDDTGVFLVPAGHYFFMGDNRDNSLDSRWSPAEDGVGFVPAENLVGKAEIVMLSWNPGASVLKPWTWFDLRLSRFFKPVV